jgi:nitrate/nitrite transport system permease protein
MPGARAGAADLPSPGLLTLAGQTLARTFWGFLAAVAVAAPLGVVLGASPPITRLARPVIAFLRALPPLAWLVPGLLIFGGSEAAVVATAALCAAGPTMTGIAASLQSIADDYWLLARALRLPGRTRIRAIVIPATAPGVVAACRRGLGAAWAASVAAEMLTGLTGLGGHVWQQYTTHAGSALAAVVLSGLVGVALDRLMALAEAAVTRA